MPDDQGEGSVEIDGATIRYRSVGEGPTIVFVHGVYVCDSDPCLPRSARPHRRHPRR